MGSGRRRRGSWRSKGATKSRQAGKQCRRHFRSQCNFLKRCTFAHRSRRKSEPMRSADYPHLQEGQIEKAPERLAFYERLFRPDTLPEGRFLALRDAIQLCAWYCVPPPKWVADAVTELCYSQICADRRPGRLGSYQARLRQHRIHLVRWAAVRHLRDNCRARIQTWQDAYDGASRELRRTIAQGSGEVMASSYKRHNRNPSLKMIRESGGAEAVADAARSLFDDREILLDVDKLFR